MSNRFRRHQGGRGLPGVLVTVQRPPAWCLAADVAARRKLFLVGGIAEREGDRLYNSAVVIGPDGVLGVYRKLHLWADENLWFEAGKCTKVMNCVTSPGFLVIWFGVPVVGAGVRSRDHGIGGIVSILSRPGGAPAMARGRIAGWHGPGVSVALHGSHSLVGADFLL
ncbi:hypothetical protein DPM13_13815 [Paracoccus mutanolyticus]|uniref:CN hydrolase domain-containing protein n=1 Tax=Paracoccus mutanolyticus TaxID=1499308 RepID=A0ABM6WT48_9RHOB|nr:nitrilase-related carbon-nitrogen hydrolase [Paracoccus mutanolyticus]AWX93752.1 hypothetical protein DPM13_13815 [Paracoccus mutanolyticus]